MPPLRAGSGSEGIRARPVFPIDLLSSLKHFQAMTVTTRTDATADSAAGHADVPDLRIFIFALFFIFGGITSLNDVVIPKLKALFTLSYGQVMLVQFAFFMAYFVVSLPTPAIVRRFGYMRTAA